MKQLILKARTGLVQKKVQVHRGGKTFQQTVWVRSGKKPKGDKPATGKVSSADLKTAITSKRVSKDDRFFKVDAGDDKSTRKWVPEHNKEVVDTATRRLRSKFKDYDEDKVRQIAHALIQHNTDAREEERLQYWRDKKAKLDKKWTMDAEGKKLSKQASKVVTSNDVFEYMSYGNKGEVNPDAQKVLSALKKKGLLGMRTTGSPKRADWLWGFDVGDNWFPAYKHYIFQSVDYDIASQIYTSFIPKDVKIDHKYEPHEPKIGI